MNILGICGYAGSGKDTAADHFVYKYGFAKVALADPLKRICKDLFDFSDEQLWGSSNKRSESHYKYNSPNGSPLTARIALQKVGTEGARACYENIWVEHLLKTSKDLLNNKTAHYSKENGINNNIVGVGYVGVVVSDVRMLNEIKGIQEAGGKVIRIVREGVGQSKVFGNHISESEMSELVDDVFDAIVYNNKSIEDLYVELDCIINLLGIKLHD